jgi:hypothetical protein
MKETILHLVRFFDKEEYADQFIEGRLRLNRLRYYKQLEAAPGDGRGDYAEAPAAWWQKTNFHIEFHDHPELNIHPENLAGPALFSFETFDNLSVLCMTAIHTGEFDLDCKSGLISVAAGDKEKLREQLSIDSCCFKMGSFAVMIQAAEFVLRAKKAIEGLGYTYNSTLVNYFDPESRHGAFPLLEMPFWKRNIFSYQREYRICVDTHTKGNDEIWIDIGDINDIAAKMPAEKVNTAYKVEFKET